MLRLLSVVAFGSILAAGCSAPSTSNNARGVEESSPSPPPNNERSQTTQVTTDCHPNYSPCVPIASDVDCAGGGGNGPAYVRGPIRVIGSDIYGLDRDGDGIACEK